MRTSNRDDVSTRGNQRNWFVECVVKIYFYYGILGVVIIRHELLELFSIVRDLVRTAPFQLPHTPGKHTLIVSLKSLNIELMDVPRTEAIRPAHASHYSFFNFRHRYFPNRKCKYSLFLLNFSPSTHLDDGVEFFSFYFMAIYLVN